jgi:hypothetical protein
MNWDRYRRRSVLATVGASLGLAGCSFLNSDSDGESPETSETGTVKRTDTSPERTADRAQADLPEHDHSGPASGGSSIDTSTLVASEAEFERAVAGRLTTAQLAADELTVGGDSEHGDRPLVSTQRQVLAVPDEYETIQAAIDAVPLVLRHECVIAVDDGTYDEHLSIPPIIAGHPRSQAGQERSGLEIYGNADQPERVRVNSLTISGCTGAVNPFVSGFTFRRANPFDDEDVAVIAYGTTETTLSEIRIRTAPERSGPLRAGIKAYGGTAMKLQSVDFGDAQCRRGVVTKHMSRVLHNEGPIEGALTEYVFWPVAGDIHFNGDNVTATGRQGLNRADNASFSFDRATRLLHGVDGFAD